MPYDALTCARLTLFSTLRYESDALIPHVKITISVSNVSPAAPPAALTNPPPTNTESSSRIPSPYSTAIGVPMRSCCS